MGVKENDRNRPMAGGAPRSKLAALCLFLFFALVQAHAGAPGIKVVGNQIVTTSAGTLGVQTVSANQDVVLRGLNMTGSEYECLVGDSVWDTIPSAETNAAYQAVINAMLAWHANVVRLPLNEDCWLAINGVPAATSGANYIGPITNFVNLANASGLIVEVDLHWGAGGTVKPKDDSFPAMDTDHSGAFWQSVATQFKGNPSVIFNLTNEPYITSWPCYLNGGCTTPKVHGASWTVLGTQSVVTTIRSTVGATNPIIIAGLNYSNQLDSWTSYVPSDPDGQIIAGIHVYFDDLSCEDATCWNDVFSGIQHAGYPIIVDETGETDAVKNTPATGDTGCGSGSEVKLTDWADAQNPQVGYWFWAFTSVDWKNCPNGPDLLEGPNPPSSYTAWPNYGTFVEAHLQAVQ
jgi:hypothetical protein